MRPGTGLRYYLSHSSMNGPQTCVHRPDSISERRKWRRNLPQRRSRPSAVRHGEPTVKIFQSTVRHGAPECDIALARARRGAGAALQRPGALASRARKKPPPATPAREGRVFRSVPFPSPQPGGQGNGTPVSNATVFQRREKTGNDWY